MTRVRDRGGGEERAAANGGDETVAKRARTSSAFRAGRVVHLDGLHLRVRSVHPGGVAPRVVVAFDHIPMRARRAASSASSFAFFFMRAFLFWNQLYTFASLIVPSLASSSVIWVRRSPLGVPMPVA